MGKRLSGNFRSGQAKAAGLHSLYEVIWGTPVQDHQVERCARLFGAAEGLLEDVGSPVYNYYEPDPRLYERTLSAARSRLGKAAFEEAWDRGRAMSFEQAVVYALSSAEQSQGEAKYTKGTR